jgi:hypothetical protein
VVESEFVVVPESGVMGTRLRDRLGLSQVQDWLQEELMVELLQAVEPGCLAGSGLAC